jgi:hypothetical protein
MALSWKTRVLLAKIETSYGVDPTPTGSANAILATNVSLSPMEGADQSRDLVQPFMGAQATIPTGLFMRLQFNVEMVPSGTAGTAPGWGPLLRACGCAQVISAGTSVTYNPISDSFESVALHFHAGGTRFVLLGARGTAVLRFNAQGIPYLEFIFTGLFAKPSAQANPTPTLSGFLKPEIVSSANTTYSIASQNLVLRSLTLDLGCDVQTRMLVGSDSVLIVDRSDRLTSQIESVGLATWDPYTAADDQSNVVVQLVHGKTAGKIATLDVPIAQVQRPTELTDQQNIIEWPLNLVPLPSAGNDQWTLALT